MIPSILLLDCSSSLTEKLKHQGFDVDSGTIGFCNGIRNLPCQVYEKDVFVYDPHCFARNEHGCISSSDIHDLTPEYSLSNLSRHIYRGATFLIFINRIVDDLKKQNEAYNWIPSIPGILFTKDYKPLAGNSISLPQ
ncbi:MAG: hypothetical protein KJ887_05605 [Candidatus Omnitrophica bacterium]|nr:hypothetical protein [Candidatus Omnitrophota bacterium]MBU1048048.1 hypothetical protein [Candidatus Omnitrophota bacterium]MBU1630928.1 hypothetical protein [Candidatus Omnitrophota bacterium]MBU1889418.1 hypothetical protein [Candidatus Omnitrophota bacterium]